MIEAILMLALMTRDGTAPPEAAPPDVNARSIEEPRPAEDPIPIPVTVLCRRGALLIDEGARGSITQARRVFDLAAHHYPGSSCAHAGLSRACAMLYYRRIEEDDSLIDLSLQEARRAVEIDPRSAEAHAAMAGALLVDLKAQEAGDEATTALALDPDSVPALQVAALARLSLGQLDLARKAIDKAVELRPDIPAGYQILGSVQLMNNEPVEAVGSYRNALRLSPDLAPAALQVAIAYDQMGNYLAAGQILRDLLQEHPEESARAYLYTGFSLMKRDSWNQALAALDKASFKTRKGLSNGTVIYLKGVCYEELGQMAKAREAFRQVIDSWPDATTSFISTERLVFPSYEALGRMHLEAREIEAAQAVMEEGIARTGASLELYLRLAHLYQEYKMPDRAAALVEQAVVRDLGPSNAGPLLACYLFWARLAGETRDRAGQERLTLKLSQQAARLESLNNYVHDVAAMRVFSISGRGEQAFEILRRAVKAGYAQAAWVASDPDLEALRATAEYRRLVEAAPAGSRSSH